MGYPKPLPELSQTEYRDLQEKIRDFEVSEEQRERINKIREKLRE